IIFTQDDVDALPAKQPDLVVKAFEGDNEQIMSPVIINATPNETVNLAIGEGEFKGLVEYDFVKGRLSSTITDENVEDFLSADMIANVARQSKNSVQEVNQFVQIKKVAKDTALDEKMLFGLAKSGKYKT